MVQVRNANLATFQYRAAQGHHIDLLARSAPLSHNVYTYIVNYSQRRGE